MPLKKIQLWDHVKYQGKVLLAATVDGGQLSWKLTQISAGIKRWQMKEALIHKLVNCSLVNVGLTTFSQVFTVFLFMFIQLSTIKTFRTLILLLFFSELNQLEDENIRGLVLAYPADMCDLS